MRRAKNPRQAAPPPAKAAAGDPDPLRRPSDPPATSPREGSNPTPETWNRPPWTLACSEGPLEEPLGQPPVGLVGCAAGGRACDRYSSRCHQPAVRKTPRSNLAEGCACNRCPAGKCLTTAVKPSSLEVQALGPHGNRGSTARSDSAQRMVEPFRPTGAPTIPLHRPSELVYADVRRAAVRVGNCVSYATDFVWDSLLPLRHLSPDPPPPRGAAISEFSDVLLARSQGSR